MNTMNAARGVSEVRPLAGSHEALQKAAAHLESVLTRLRSLNGALRERLYGQNGALSEAATSMIRRAGMHADIDALGGIAQGFDDELAQTEKLVG